jgi:hypothetical protein
MPRIPHRQQALAMAALLLLLSGCDKMRSTEPPPSFESPTVGAAREISGVQATPAATPPSAPAASK